METTIKKTARRAGIFYLAFVVTCIFAGVVRSQLIVYDDASKTADLLRNSMGLLRIIFVDDLVSAVLFLLAAWALYVLLKPVQKNLALLFLLLNAAGVAVQCLSLLCLFAPLWITDSADIQKAFQPNQIEALNLLFLNLHKSGFTIAQIFFGTWLFHSDSTELYNKYESGTSDIPIGIISEISEYFNIELSVMLGGDNPKLRIYSVVRNGKGLKLERRKQYRYESLAYNFIHKKAEPFMVTIDPREDEALPEFNSHPGQEFNYVVKGTMMTIIDGHEIILNEGDSIFFNSAYKHAMKALNNEQVRFLAIVL